jgi:hypothetical protein
LVAALAAAVLVAAAVAGVIVAGHGGRPGTPLGHTASTPTPTSVPETTDLTFSGPANGEMISPKVTCIASGTGTPDEPGIVAAQGSIGGIPYTFSVSGAIQGQPDSVEVDDEGPGLGFYSLSGDPPPGVTGFDWTEGATFDVEVPPGVGPAAGATPNATWLHVTGHITCPPAVPAPTSAPSATPTTAPLSTPTSATTPTSSPAAIGAWRVFNGPAAGVTSWLSGVTCISATDCWAVGEMLTAGAPLDTTLIEHYAGGVWTVDPSSGVTPGALDSVACVTSAECWAVGAGLPGGLSNAQPLIEQLSGGAWNVVSGPAVTEGGQLFSVACVESGRCWAVGFEDGSGSLIEQYSGSTWSVGPIAEGTSLSSITCPTEDDCWAVGGGPAHIVHYATGAWSTYDTSAIGDMNDGLGSPSGMNSITCPSAAACWALGNTSDGRPLTLQYSGGAWTEVGSPMIADGGMPAGVACYSQDDCWAVGNAVIEHYDGTTWTVAPSPDVTGNADLSSVACPGSGGCWAVGGVSNADAALIETNTEAGAGG